MLGEAFLKVVEGWEPAFARENSFKRAVRLATGLLCSVGRATTSRALLTLGLKDEDWSANYRLCSRAPWDENELFASIVKEALSFIEAEWVVMAFDDTRLKKTGKKVPGAQWHRDPLSPPFRYNLIYGLRFLQVSILVPLHDTPEKGARGIPVCFESAPCIKKPGKKASPETLEEYKKAKKTHNLSTLFSRTLWSERERLDEAGAKNKLFVASVDGSFCNRQCFGDIPARTVLLARTRKDTKLCFLEPKGSRKTYSPEKFNPEDVRKDESIPYQTAEFTFGGAKRELRFKVVENAVWQRGSKTKLLTLLVLAPTPYKTSPKGETYYRQPAYLLCTSVGLDHKKLIQAYIDRWQIEVNHKDEKDVLGVGQAQVWSQKAVPRQPAFAVACYSALLLASLKAFGPGRTEAFPALPKWRKHQRRPSLQDLLTMLRQEFANPNSILGKTVNAPPGYENLITSAAA